MYRRYLSVLCLFFINIRHFPSIENKRGGGLPKPIVSGPLKKYFWCVLPLCTIKIIISGEVGLVCMWRGWVSVYVERLCECVCEEVGGVCMGQLRICFLLLLKN